MNNVMQSNYAAVSVPVVTVSKANTSWSNQKSGADHACSFKLDAGERNSIGCQQEAVSVYFGE